VARNRRELPIDSLWLFPSLRMRQTGAGGSATMRQMVRSCVMASTVALAVAGCAADANHQAAPVDQQDDDEDTTLATWRTRQSGRGVQSAREVQIGRDVAAVLQGMRLARLTRLAALGAKR
jgi:hypothetical protein